MAKYKFIGTDGSMGYRTGKVYHGTLEESFDGRDSFVFVPGIFPFNVFSRKVVIPYSSLGAFYKNWDEA